MYSRKSIIKKTRQKKVVAKSRILVRKAVVVLVLFFFVVGILAWQSGNKKVIITEIKISGNEVVNEKDIQVIIKNEIKGKYGWLFHRDNIFIYPKYNIKERLFALDKRIQKVDIYRDSLTAIAVEISERKPSYLWCLITEESLPLENNEKKRNDGKIQTLQSRQKNCHFLDKTGYIFAKAPQFSGSVFFTFHTSSKFYASKEFANSPLGNLLFEKEEFEKLIMFKKEIEKLDFDTVSLIEKKEGDYDLILENGVKIMFNKKQNLTEVLENLDSSIETIKASEKVLEYIDLRFGNKVFYKFK